MAVLKCGIKKPLQEEVRTEWMNELMKKIRELLMEVCKTKYTNFNSQTDKLVWNREKIRLAELLLECAIVSIDDYLL